MSFRIVDKGVNEKINRDLQKASEQHSDSMQKLSSGEVFTKNDPRPSERALAEKMEFKLRGLASAKRNINDAVSLLQTAEGAYSEINNIITRMKEINISAANTSVTDVERKFLFIEYSALYDEVSRIAQTTEFNGIPLLDGKNEKSPAELVFRLGDPSLSEDVGSEDLNILRMTGFNEISARPELLGLQDVKDILSDLSEDTGLSLQDAEDLLLPEDDLFPTSYDQALATLTNQRAAFGAVQARLARTLDYVDVYHENIAAAKSKISDTDYISEVSKMVESKIRMNASTAMLAQSNFAAQTTLSLISALS